MSVRVVRRLIGALILALLSTGTLLTSPATGAPIDCQVFDKKTGLCLVTAVGPGSGGGSSGGGTGGSGSSSGGTAAPEACVDKYNGGVEVPCSSSLGYWSNGYSCYVQAMNPQPPKDSPLWEGNTEGAVYNCSAPTVGAGGTGGFFFWSLNPPAGPVVVDPAVLAQQALDGMGLRAIDIGIVPEPGPASVGLVGLPVYMWTDPTVQTFGPNTASASAGGVTVTVNAEVDRIEWNMGDGTTVTCTTAGTPYVDAYGSTDSPDCGHRYERSSAREPGDAYTVTATSYWNVTWNGGGQNGTIPLDFTSQTQIRVGELQVLQTR